MRTIEMNVNTEHSGLGGSEAKKKKKNKIFRMM